MRLASAVAIVLACLGNLAANAGGLSKALDAAGANRAEIERALRECPVDQRASLEWLVERMPDADLRALDARFLLAHVGGAHAAWKGAPWSALVSEEIFRDAILPYASVSERRELWLPVLREKCLPMVRDAKSPAEAAVMLNQRVFPEFKVQYSTKRRRADQSPSESMETGLASCTGLSILLIDACRSVGVPARFVGVPMWTDGSGNHSWVEVWDGSSWRYTGAAEPTGDRLDEGWFSGRASTQNRSKPEHAIYAVTWRESGVEFPFMFDPSRPRARAVDVTDRYAGKAPTIPDGHRMIRVAVRDEQTGLRVEAAVELRDSAGNPIASGVTKDERFDLNDHLELVVPVGAQPVYLVNGTETAAPEFREKPGEVPLATLVWTSQRRAAPGAVRDDSAWLLDASFMPAEVVAVRPDARPVRELESFLRSGSVADAAKQPFAKAELDEGDANAAANLLRNALEAEIRRTEKEEFESKLLEADGAKMPFWYAVYGERPAGGRSLYISMHGGGGAPKEVNDRQWENQKRLYKPEEGVYVAPRAPTDTWNLWHQGHVDALFRELIADMVVFEDVNPDRVYLMGYSAGGDGVYQLAPRMADSFAAAAMMAGHPNETRPDGLRNLPFALYMGGQDAAFNRNEIARQWKTMLADLAAKDPGGYPHTVTVFEEHGHWMERKDAVAVPWMASQRRNLRPRRIVWLQDDVTSQRFYWLENRAPQGGQRVVASLEGQSVRIEEAAGPARLTILLDDSMVDLDAPVSVAFGGRTLFQGKVARTIATIARTLGERRDPAGIFTAEISVDLSTDDAAAAKEPIPSGS